MAGTAKKFGNTGTLSNLNTGIAGSVSDAMNTEKLYRHNFFLKPRSGDTTGALIRVQYSHDGTTWYNCEDWSPTLSNINEVWGVGPVVSSYVRLYVWTASALPSRSDIEMYSL